LAFFRTQSSRRYFGEIRKNTNKFKKYKKLVVDAVKNEITPTN